MITSSAIDKIMKNICSISTKIQYIGIMTNYMQRNKGYVLCPTPL